MEELRTLLKNNLNKDFITAVLSNPRDKELATKVKVRPLLQKDQLVFQVETFKNNQAFHENLDAEVIKLYELKKYFVEGLSKIADTQVNGFTDGRSAPHVISFSVQGIRSEVLLHALEDKGVYVSAGSACASNHPQTSRTLMAIGLDKSLWDSTIRFSMSVFTTKAEIDYTLKCLYELIPMLRRYTRH